MKQYLFTVSSQCIKASKNYAFVSGSAEIYEAVFTFNASWDGFARTAVFECGGERREQLLVNDRCIVPWEILHAGAYLRVGVYGVSGDATMPTVYSGTMFVARGAEPSEAAREHSADMFDQIVEIGQQAAEAKEQWENMSAEAETLPAGTPATASYAGGILSLGIPAGAQGPQGAQGERGATGPQGAAGPKGEKGDTGDTGPQGPKGDTGETGATGPQGPQGVQGVQGPAGADGADGSDGITPTIGENGNWYLGDTDTGKPSRGVQGPQGERGLQGTQGPKGDTGDIGPQGPQGIQGVQGPAGANGSDGADGVTFTPSVDASGNISWTNDGGKQDPTPRNIKGPQGEQGIQGPKGDTGETGAQGPKGDTGAQGPQGIQGPSGMLNFSDTLPATAAVNTIYSLGTVSAVATALPDGTTVGDIISIIWYNGVTPATVTITGTILPFTFTPTVNLRTEISAMWDGANWSLVAYEQAVV